MRKFFIWLTFIGDICKAVGGVADGVIKSYDDAKSKCKIINDEKADKERKEAIENGEHLDEHGNVLEEFKELVEVTQEVTKL